jgi:hypothetical protein
MCKPFGIGDRVGADSQGVPDVHADADPRVEFLDLLINAFRGRIQLVSRPVVVNRHLDVELLDPLVDQRQHLVRGSGHDRPHPRRPRIVKRLVDIAVGLHRHHAAAVQVKSSRFDFGGRGGNLVGRGVQRQMETLQADVRQAHPLGHRQCLVKVELAQRVRRQTQGKWQRFWGVNGSRSGGRAAADGQRRTGNRCQFEKIASGMCVHRSHARAFRWVMGHWSLVTGDWSLVTGHWSLVTGHWSLVTGHWSLVGQQSTVDSIQLVWTVNKMDGLAAVQRFSTVRPPRLCRL